MTSGGREVDVGGEVPNFKYGRNKPESEFLTGQAEYSRSCECLGSCLAMERSMMKSSTLFHVFDGGPLPPTSTSRPPDIIHVIGVPRPSPGFFLRSSVAVHYTERKPKNENGGGLGTRLVLDSVLARPF